MKKKRKLNQKQKKSSLLRKTNTKNQPFLLNGWFFSCLSCSWVSLSRSAFFLSRSISSLSRWHIVLSHSGLYFQNLSWKCPILDWVEWQLVEDYFVQIQKILNRRRSGFGLRWRTFLNLGIYKHCVVSSLLSFLVHLRYPIFLLFHFYHAMTLFY